MDRGTFTFLLVFVGSGIVVLGLGVGSCVMIGVRAAHEGTMESRKMQCAINLRQIGIASQLYLNDHRALPFAGDDASGHEHIQLLFDEGILDDPEVVICAISTDRVAPMADDGTIELADWTCSYLWANQPLDDSSRVRTPLAADDADHHLGGRNVLYVDGSVRWVTTTEFEEEVQPFLTAD